MNNILITSAGRRVSLIKAFKKEFSIINPKGEVYVSDLHPDLSAAAQIADKAFKTCRIEDEDYISLLLQICIDNNIKLIIPTIDTELLILSKNEDVFYKNGISIVLSDENFIETTNDKVRTQDFFVSHNIKVAKIYDKKNYKLPFFIKPISGSGSEENYIISTEDQLSKYHLKNKDLCFFEYFDQKVYDEYSCDLYYDKKSNLKCIIPRKRIEVRGGEVSKAITCDNHVKKELEGKFQNLDGVRGCITVQVFCNKQNNSIIGIEINPRFGGGFPLSYLAGGNFPKWIIEEYFLGQGIKYFDDWENDLLMLRYDDEILTRDE